MPRAFFRLFTPLIAGLAVLVVAPAAQAQSPFSAAVYVNDDAITNYEITQKRRFLEYIGAAGSDPRALALERVIEDRLQLQEAERLGGRLTPDQITDGMTEFATRVQLSADEMLAQMRQAGIAHGLNRFGRDRAVVAGHKRRRHRARPPRYRVPHPRRDGLAQPGDDHRGAAGLVRLQQARQ